jgi:minor extracellular serine protease Vpr
MKTSCFAFARVFPGCCLLLTFTFPPAFAVERARVETRTDAAVEEFGVTGRGVLIAVLDRGLDYMHPDFRNSDGTTRVEGIFDLTDDTGANAPGNTYGMGTIYTKAQVQTALNTGVPLTHRDAVGHGTTTTGLAAGNGRGRSDRLYRGMAPEASLLVVKVTSDGAPAHDGEPAEAAYFNRARLFTAMDFVKAKAAELQMPSVMILNLGSMGGPTDGTSSLARKIDSVVGPGIPGLVFLSGPGDDGGASNRAAGTIAQGETKTLTFEKATTGNLRLEIWYPDFARYDVVITTPGGANPSYPSPAGNNDLDQRTVAGQYTYFHYGSARDSYEATVGKRLILIDFSGPVGSYSVALTGATAQGGRFDASLNPSRITSANRFTSFVAPDAGSIWDGAAAFYNISPNSYVWRNTWKDIDGFNRTFTGEGNPGEIWKGSSIGPTLDGRIGVDVSAPGDRAITTYAPRSYWGTFRFNVVEPAPAMYGIASAVSSAAPMTTGVIALMLEANPRLDAPAVKRILQQSARSDAFTGAVPNTSWGYGKLDAHAAVAKVFREIPTGGSLSPSLRVAGPGEATSFTATASGSGSFNYQWLRNGRLVPGTTSAQLPLANVQPADTGVYRSVLVGPTATTATNFSILGLTSATKVVGAGTEVGSNILHPNQNVFDQVLLQGAAASVKADSAERQILRISYVDLNNDIVQIEFAGAGTLSLVLDSASGPAAPVNYNQAVTYMKGHAGIVVMGADENTHLSVFSVGRANAVNQALFRDDVQYDGFADIAFIAIASTDGKFGGLRAANASFFATKGITGVYAPGVNFTGPVFVGDIDGRNAAHAMLALGSGSDVRITGGDLLQGNGGAVEVSGITQLKFAAGSTSHGGLLSAQNNRAKLEQNGVDVTTQIVVNPIP